MPISEDLLGNLMSMIATGMLTLIIGLIGLLWKQMTAKLGSVDARLRTLGHEDREIRSQLHGVMTTLIEHLNDESKVQLKAENDRLKWMIESLNEESKK